ncbi:MAG TPA: AAA family ATPase [Candidatus Tectomicrobia bacterium]|nr:AAA family ATPase [Candidatus Tectomicrobia bacterium]
MGPVKPLEATALYQRCDPTQFSFETTAELADLTEMIGQTRAVEAVRFGVGIRRDGFNLFALGPEGTGKYTLVRHYLERQAATQSPPSDWCYVNNFAESYKPRVLRLPPGGGSTLRRAMERLVEELRTAIATIFESENYRTRRQEIEEEFRERQEKALTDIQRSAQERGLALIRTPMGLAFAPTRGGQVINPEDFQKLPPEQQERIQADVAMLQEELQKSLAQMPQWDREHRTKVKDLEQEIGTYAVAHLIEELRRKYADLPEVVEYLRCVQQDVMEHLDEFRGVTEAVPVSPGEGGPTRLPGSVGAPFFRRYRVNVLVDHSGANGAPVIYEDHPTVQNLMGRVEHMAQMGALVTDFNLIKAGALHHANGGYLILEARKALLQPFTWEELKRALRSQEIRIEALGQMLSLVSTVSLEPEPIPLDVKVVLLGERLLYYMLAERDPDFGELFKVAADFEDQMDRTAENHLLYARMIATMVRQENLRPLDRQAVARVIEQSARLAGDAERLSTHVRSIADLLREADYWAGEVQHRIVTAADVQRAIDSQIHRSDRVRERIQEEIQRGTILIDTRGAQVGQVNGLSVFTLGQFPFGRPSRITARVRLGRGEVVDIEREVALGGPIHSKGVLILSGYLGARYALERPLSLSASLVFEQSYSGVEGDSASSAELYALLSALADLPIKQGLAVTGSVNQHGQVQAIGGVNEKIEGFFDICRAQGFTGAQGVLIPASNVKHLMLRRDIVDAATAEQFHIFAVETIDQGIELLTGVPAGERGDAGEFPAGSVNQLVEARLLALSEKRLAFGPPEREGRGDGRNRG